MPLSKLSVFSKDTDANEVLKGYEYQKLRTLENWLSNKVNKIEEVIYCEYEDDIFQRDIVAGTSKFIQIKLYGSKSFSFKSEEITKAIANFFMLFVKGEYSFDSVQFVFETNTAIAAKYGDNDAELLKEWFENQDKIDAQLLQKYADKIKSIVTDYIREEFPKVKKAQRSEAESALIDFNNLPQTVWKDFAKSIKWVFNDKSPDDAIEITFNSIREFIKELPFPSVEGKVDTVFTTLYYEVSVKMFQNEAENRCLTNQKIDSLILELGDEADKQYNLVFEAWNETTEIKCFNLAEFIEVLHSANHCRQSSYLKEHSAFWLKLLNQYIQFANTPDRYRQKAIYEFLWLSLRPEWLKEPKGSLIGLNHLIEIYFSDISKFDDHEAIEDNFSLLQIVRASIIMDKSDFPMEKTKDWLKEIGLVINTKVESIENANEKCYWLELQTRYLSNPLDEEGKHFDTDKIFQSYEKLIQLILDAPLYNVTRLSDRLNQFIKIYIQVGTNDKYVDSLEELADKLMPFVSNRSGNHKLAKTYVDRGVKYLHNTNPHHLAKALDYFHKAKDLWLQGETGEGYVLSLLNISQLYSELNMNLAAKYYALSAAWFSINNNPEKLAKRIANSFGLLVDCDYKQGSWFSALESFKYYMRSRINFDGRPLDEKDSMLMKSFAHVAAILTMAPKISTQLTGFIQFQKQQMGKIYKEFIEPLVNEFEDIVEKKKLQDIIQSKLDAAPINDIGKTRTLEWKAFGSVWSVSFPNTWLYNSLGEEFAAGLQILLVELASSPIDLHFIRTNVEIEIVESDALKTPEQIPSNHSFKWKIFSTQVNVADRDKIRFQMASLILSMKYLLRDVSMLEDDNFFEIVDKLFQNEALADKTMTSNLYQRIYKSLFTEELFNESQREVFANELLTINLEEDKILAWNDKPSPVYSTEESLKQIEGRYKNAFKATYLTIEHLKKQPGYSEWLDNLREKKWVNWQILLAMFNHILSYKTNRFVSGKTYPSDEIARQEFQKAFQEIQYMDEKDNYVEFPLEYFKGKEFDFQLDQTGFLVMRTWGMENRATFPNFLAIRDFLNYRFNYGIDDIKNLSPF
jgi:hypothetical protein